MNILIADDAGYVVELLKNIFEEQGHSIVGVATTGNEAVELTHQLHPDVVFLDLVMPDLNGLEAAVEILKSNPRQNIIACSSLEEKWVQQKTLEAGCKYFLAKPFEKNEVIESLRHIDLNEEGVKHG